MHGYDPNKEYFSLNLHDCSFIVANTLCQYVLESFQLFSAHYSLDLIFGYASHNNQNKGIMRNMVVGHLAEYAFSPKWNEKNKGMVTISQKVSINTVSSIDPTAQAEPKLVIGLTLKPNYGPANRTSNNPIPHSEEETVPQSVIEPIPKNLSYHRATNIEVIENVKIIISSTPLLMPLGPIQKKPKLKEEDS